MAKKTNADEKHEEIYDAISGNRRRIRDLREQNMNNTSGIILAIVVAFIVLLIAIVCTAPSGSCEKSSTIELPKKGEIVRINYETGQIVLDNNVIVDLCAQSIKNLRQGDVILVASEQRGFSCGEFVILDLKQPKLVG